MPGSTRLALLALSTLGLGACSTLVTGTTQQIAITTPDAIGTTCQLTGGDGVNVTINPPATVRVAKSKRDIEVTCTAPGRPAVARTVSSTYSNWSIVEYPLGYPIDAATGAMWRYPQAVAIPFGAAVATQRTEAVR